ncbi:response regulator receiver domain protein [Bacteriovorax sp. BAL6_X]|uniref:response regulator transcription factor n=1 Tax=Bacteriovorax sp. BAL6_X TaxID=1201290 RepID=UPI0003855E7B|nr:response regulator transcription factor [Bacteriovorax sp. BAL6_X]EPZ51761.1 response regulator receiver domain protein [Bacteriovorax sp. BAL6_X]
MSKSLKAQKPHVTIVDDDSDNLENYQDLLEDDFDLELIQNPLELLSFLNTNKTDIMVLDLHMPEVNGFELFSKARELAPRTPVIFLTGDPSEEACVKGLQIGAQDFIVKPVTINELVARIKNKVEAKKSKHRRKKKNEINFEDHNFSINLDQQNVTLEGKEIKLTTTEYKIITLLASNPNKIFSRDHISQVVWADSDVNSQNIDTHLSNLRRKIKPFSNYIKTIKSRGVLLRL